jgi:outer membrane protein OmpA-like peptidoglycan-associated protein
MPGAGQPGALPPSGAPPQGSSPFVVDVDCPLEAGPRTGSVSGRILDADKMTPVEGASLKVADMGGKEIAVAVGAGGTFKGDALPAGPVTLKAEAPDYVLRQQTVDIKPQQDVQVDLTMRKRASSGDVEVAANEIKIKKQIHFETNSAKINPDSTALVEEIADVINRTTRIKRVEIQGHTDNTGGKDHNKTLSQQRANTVREALIALGVDGGRVVAVGYGQEKPLSPNATPQGRERNRRVQFMIVDQDKAGGATGAAKTTAKKNGGGGATTAKPKPKAALPF